MPSMGAIARKTSGRLSAVLTQKRRVWSTSSGFSSSVVPATGTSAMPHFGHEPGPSRTISGCIGQVYFAPAGAFGASVRPACTYFCGSAWNFCAHCLLQK